MTQTQQRAGWTPVTTEEYAARGEALRRRMLALQLDPSKLERSTGKTRKTINRALAGEASATTLEQLELWFDREERKAGMGGLDVEPEPAERERKPVSIRMEEGGTLVVSGPVDTPEDAELLKDITRDLMREWKKNRPGDTPSN